MPYSSFSHEAHDCEPFEEPTMGFERNVRIFTKPHEAIFPLDLSKVYPYPADQHFKSLSIETVYVHFTDGHPMQTLQMPKGMRSFAKGEDPLHKRYDAGLRFPEGDAAVLFHLSYDISKQLLDGFVDYTPSPAVTKVSHVELDYVITFSPEKD
jgi:hypothetical protein